MTGHIPSHIKLHKRTQRLELQFAAETFDLPAEFLRVHSPSAEVRGHGEGQAVLQYGKRDVEIIDIDQQGHYAIRLVFDDGHDSGIYTWDYLYELGSHQETLWHAYLEKLASENKTREAGVSGIKIIDP